MQVKETDNSGAGVGSSSSRKNPPLIQKDEKHEKTTFMILQKNTKSMNSSERQEELFSEVHRVNWDAILISETRRQGKEVWETQQGHIVVESGKFTNKHGVAIIHNKVEKPDQLGPMRVRTSGRSIDFSQQTTDNLGECVHATQWIPGLQVKKTYKTIKTGIEKDKSMKIMGGDFIAELGPGEGIELSSVGHYTLNKANSRGEWMRQWLLDNTLVALNTMYKKLPQKQTRKTLQKWKETAELHSDRQKTLLLEQRRRGQRHN